MTNKVSSPMFRKFCKLFGDHEVRSQVVNWNVHIQNKIAGGKGGVADGFNALLEEIEKCRDCCGDEITRLASGAGPKDMTDMADFLFQVLDAALKEMHFHEIPMSKPFLKAMKDAKLEFRTALHELYQEYLDAIEGVKHDTVIPGADGATDDSYIGLSMAPTYRDAAAIDNKKMVLPEEPQITFTTSVGRPKGKKRKVTKGSMAHEQRKEMLRVKLATGNRYVSIAPFGVTI